MANNLEAKFACDDLTAAERGAVELGASFGGELRQVDTYFRVTRGRLKLREQLAPAATAELIRYDRADDRSIRLSRYERLPIDDPRGFATLLTAALGEPWAIVRKTRRLYRFEAARIHLDRVEELGDFLEIEVVLPPERREPNASDRDLAARVAVAIGALPDRLHARSYSDLLESNRGGGYKG